MMNGLNGSTWKFQNSIINQMANSLQTELTCQHFHETPFYLETTNIGLFKKFDPLSLLSYN